MGALSRVVAQLEQAAASGALEGRDLAVIETQVARAEEKVLKLVKGSALDSGVRATLLPVE